MKVNLKFWNRFSFGNIFERKEELKRNLQELVVQVINSPYSEGLRNQERQLLSDFHNTLRCEEVFWKQKARIKWQEEGDQNTKFFHTAALRHRSLNRIKEIMWSDDARSNQLEDIRQEAVDFFKTLLTKEDLDEEETLLESIPNLVSKEGKVFLISPLSEEEIKKVAFDLGGDRAPGPDGFPAAFFQKFWHIVGKDIVEALQEFQKTRTCPLP